jgi:uncharacterized protein (DUF1330 family)
MSKGYWIVSAEVSDMEKFNEYARRTPAAIEKFGGQFLVRGGIFEKVEGDSRSRNTIIEFPSFESALACWNSPEYLAAKNYRLGAAQFNVVIVEGI